MAADVGAKEMDSPPSEAACEREFDDIKSMLEGMSVDITNEIQTPSVRNSFKKCSIRDKQHDFSMDLLLVCDDDEFQRRLTTLSTMDLDLAIMMIQQQIRIDQQIATDADATLIKNDDSTRSIACLKERKTMCDSMKIKKRRLLQGASAMDTQRLRNTPGKPNRFKLRESATSMEFESMTVEQLQDVLQYYHFKFDPSLDKEGLLVLLLNDLMETAEGEEGDWEPPSFNAMDWHSPTSLDSIEEDSAGVAERGEEYVANRVDFTKWNSTTMLTALLENTIVDEQTVEDAKRKTSSPTPSRRSSAKQQMSGYLEKLPVNQTKVKAFKGWKRRYFSIDDGRLFYFEHHTSEAPLGSIALRGSEIVVPGEKVIQLSSQGKGEIITLRCATISETRDWYHSLHEEAVAMQQFKVEPVAAKNKEQSVVVVIDLGASSVKAGLTTFDRPQIAIPSVVAVPRDGPFDPVKCQCGVEAYLPDARENSKLIFPLRPHLKVDQFAIQKEFLPCFIDKVFTQLKVDPTESVVIVSCPRYLSEKDKEFILDYLFGHHNVRACYMDHQSLLSLYSYSSTSGIIVDIGDHIDVVPVVEGCIIEAGVSSFPYGGQQVTESLSKLLSESGHRFFSEVESLIVRYIKEKCCFVRKSSNDLHNEKYTVDLEKFTLPDGTRVVEVGSAAYRSTEGLFRPDMWGKDNKGLHNNVDRAVRACDVDMRRELCRKIYLTGGTTLLEGLAERLKTELKSMVAASVSIQVHADPHRNTAAFRGAVTVAQLPTFDSALITNDAWKNGSPQELLKKWRKS